MYMRVRIWIVYLCIQSIQRKAAARATKPLKVTQLALEIAAEITINLYMLYRVRMHTM